MEPLGKCDSSSMHVWSIERDMGQKLRRKLKTTHMYYLCFCWYVWVYNTI